MIEIRPNRRGVTINVHRLNSSKTQTGSKAKIYIIRPQSEICVIFDDNVLQDPRI